MTDRTITLQLLGLSTANGKRWRQDCKLPSGFHCQQQAQQPFQGP
jgi:hypothetical protein